MTCADRPVVVLFAGLPYSGKTGLIQHLCEVLPGEPMHVDQHFRQIVPADEVRLDRWLEENPRLTERMFAHVRATPAARHYVEIGILRASHRRALRARCEEMGYLVLPLLVVCDARAEIARRQQARADSFRVAPEERKIAIGLEELYGPIRRAFDPIEADEGYHVIDTCQPIGACIDQIRHLLAALQRRHGLPDATGEGTEMPLADERLLEMYRRMLLVRFMEERHLVLAREGRIHVNPHLGTGQEAVAIGATGALRQDDIMFGTHRGVGEYIGKGMTPQAIWTEYLEKRTGLCKGKATQHLADRANGIPGLAACLGSDFSMAVGTALAARMRRLDQVTLFYVGEGSCNEGDANPAMCMAALWQLPLVFAICNNQYCEMSHMREHFPTDDVAPRAAGYGIPFEIVDGQDIDITLAATERAIAHARAGRGPYVLEYKTFRMAPHYAADPALYVPREDLATWARRDPIDMARIRLLARGTLDEQGDAALRARLRAEVEAALEAARAEPDPLPADLYEDVLAPEAEPVR